jgi:hypothetical protein
MVILCQDNHSRILIIPQKGTNENVFSIITLRSISIISVLTVLFLDVVD